MAPLSQARTPCSALTNRPASGSFTHSAADPGQYTALKDDPMPDRGAQQSHTPAHRESGPVRPKTKEVARQALGHNRTTAKGTAMKHTSTPLEPVVLPPHDDPASTVGTRSDDFEQRHQSPQAKLSSGRLHRTDFEVKHIRRKDVVEGRTLLSVRWRSSWVPLDAIIKGDDEDCAFVEADGAKCYIRKQLDIRTRNGLQERKVRWTSTWEPLENLNNAQEAIADFEATEHQATLDVEHRVRQRRVLTFEESKFPRGIVRLQSKHDYAASQRWVACTWPMIRPHSTLDLYPAIYRIQMELSAVATHGGKSYRSLMRRPQVRPLLWSKEFIEAGKPFPFNRRTRAALFLQATGELDTRNPCTRCLGEKRAPFVGCVRNHTGQQSWLGGACANCGTQDNSTCTHHNKGLLRRGKSITPRQWSNINLVLTALVASHNRTPNIAHAGYHQRPYNGSGLQGSSAANNDDDDNGDDSDDSDADSDVALDDKVDNNKDDKPFDNPTVYASTENRREPSYKCPNTASPSAKAYLSPSSATDPPAVHSARGKLPKTSKTRSAPRVAASAPAPVTPPSTQPSQDSTDSGESKRQPMDVKGTTALNPSQHNGGEPRPHITSFPENLEDTILTDDEYIPLPVEADALRLLAKHVASDPLVGGRLPRVGMRLGCRKRIPPASAQPHGPDAAAHGVGGGQLSATTTRKRRADSIAPNSKRHSSGLIDQSPKLSVSDSPLESSSSREDHPASGPLPRTFMRTRTLDRMEPKSTHSGCVAGRPCNDHHGESRPKPRDPHAKVYHNSLDCTTSITEAQAEYILSQSNCYWAWKFSWIWSRWCAEKDLVNGEEYSQMELLLRYPEQLRNAAQDCCPRGKIKVIEID